LRVIHVLWSARATFRRRGSHAEEIPGKECVRLNYSQQAAALASSLLPRPEAGPRAGTRVLPAGALTALSLFSGGGGLDLGFSAAGFTVACSSDIDPFSCKTLVLNKGRMRFYKHAHSIAADIRTISAAQLLKEADLEPGSIDIVLGGPPCQAFSVFGRRKGLNDPRGGLVWEYLRIIREVQPRVFVFENVAGLKSIHGGKLYGEILAALADCGYTVSGHNYQMAEFGIPQFRDRVFFIGSRDGTHVPSMLPTHGLDTLFAQRPYRNAKEALRLLPEPGTGSVPNHLGRDHSGRIVRRYRSLEYGERDHHTRINKLHPDQRPPSLRQFQRSLRPREHEADQPACAPVDEGGGPLFGRGQAGHDSERRAAKLRETLPHAAPHGDVRA
jgi:DNA (cytosine-5)-methyltransferase 1